MGDPYRAVGVSADKEEVHAAVAGLDRGAAPGAFCHLVEDPTDPGSLAVLHSDGAGSKAIIAYLAYRCGYPARVFRTLAQDAAVMNLDDMACVGATEDFLLTNTVGRNADLVGAEPLAELLAGYRDFADLMAQQRVRVQLCGGETADLADQVRTLTVDCSVHARLPKERLVDFSGVQPGTLIVGLSSVGRAIWERRDNSGMGANGLTLARHLLLSPDAWRDFPEAAPYHDEMPRGRFGLDQELPGCSMSLADALLSATRPHVALVRRLQEASVPLHGIIHCTGGGQTKCLHFGSGLHYVKHSPFEPPPLFALIAQEGQLSPQQMYRVFNMGHRMEIYCPPDALQAICEEAERLGIRAGQIGEVQASDSPQNRLTIRTADGEIDYGG